MKLFCRKCDKEIEKYTVRKSESFDGSFEFTITVCCHGEKDKRSIYSWAGSFNFSDYGDLFFFKKDEHVIKPLKISDEFMGFIKNASKKWDELVEEYGQIPDILKGNTAFECGIDIEKSKTILSGLEAERDKPKNFTPLEDILIKENHTLMRELAFLKGPSLGCVKDCGWLVGKDKEIEKLKEQNKELSDELSLLNEYYDKTVALNTKIDIECEKLKKENEGIQSANEILRDEVNDLYKEMNRLKSPLTWTKDKPTEPGWYYYKEEERQITWKVYRVFPIDQYISPSEVCEVKEVGFTVLIGVGTFKPVEQMNGEWAGPIPEPIEPEKIKVKWRRYQVADRTYTESYPVIEDCCKTWKRKPLSYNVDEDKWKLLIPTFCPECGKKL
uniref:Uncharacterized protein n=1 Tax=viral metagenome TaxID=1070528 RepID=A0A6H1ZKR5_9ZZZZ